MDILAFWRAVIEQRREALPAYFAPDAVIRWHCTNERFTVAEYIRANCDYPGEWMGTVERIDRTENGYVTAVRVYPPDRSAACHAVSFMTLKEDRIAALDEYWADDGEAPDWRKQMHLGRPIRREEDEAQPEEETNA